MLNIDKGVPTCSDRMELSTYVFSNIYEFQYYICIKCKRYNSHWNFAFVIRFICILDIYWSFKINSSNMC